MRKLLEGYWLTSVKITDQWRSSTPFWAALLAYLSPGRTPFSAKNHAKPLCFPKISIQSVSSAWMDPSRDRSDKLPQLRASFPHHALCLDWPLQRNHSLCFPAYPSQSERAKTMEPWAWVQRCEWANGVPGPVCFRVHRLGCFGDTRPHSDSELVRILILPQPPHPQISFLLLLCTHF